MVDATVIGTAVFAIAVAIGCGGNALVDASQEHASGMDAGGTDGGDAGSMDTDASGDAQVCSDIQAASIAEARSAIHSAHLDTCTTATDCYQINFSGSCFECGVAMTKGALDGVMPLATEACAPFFDAGCALSLHSCPYAPLACMDGTCQYAH